MATRIAPRGSLRRGLKVQGNVIGALIMRELHTRYGRDNIGYVWLILEPMMLATMIALLHQQTGGHFGNDVKPVPFALIGYCIFIMFRSIFGRAEGALEANLPLLYHKTVTIFDILLARALLEAAGCILSFMILMSLAVAMGLADLPARPLYVCLGVACMFFLAFGLSLVVCAFTFENRAMGRLVHPIAYIMLPLSGVFVMMQWVPAKFRPFFSVIPMSHIFEMLRYGWFVSAVPYFIDAWYLAGWIFGSTLFGLLAIAAVKRKIHMP